MANNNYPQPFGYPYAYPPPPPHADEAQMPPQHAPPQNPFHHNMPGLQPPALPGINFASHAQNNQQPPFPQAAWPPQLPPDPSAWMHLLQQNGLPPPPLPGLPFGPPSLPQTPQSFPTPMPFMPPHLPPTAPPNHAPAGERVTGVMEADREDGELSDAGADVHPPVQSVAQRNKSQKRAPRSVPQNGQASMSAEGGYNPDRPSDGQAPTRNGPQSVAQRESSPSLADQLPPFRDEAKQFVKLLHSHNIGYQVLAKEDLDTEKLREMYKSLNLPSEPELIPSPQTNGDSSKMYSAPVAPMSVLGIKTNVTSVPTAKAVASPTTPGDRKDYIARLQAAKKAKQAGAAKASSPHQIQSAKPIASSSTAATPQAVTTPTGKPTLTTEQLARRNEILKERLQAYRSKQKPSAPEPHAPEDSPVVPSKAVGSLTRGDPTSNQHNQMGDFQNLPGLPGLFMNAKPDLPVESSSVAKPASTVPQKRPVASTPTTTSTPTGSVTPYTRPLGQSPHANHVPDDSMIIEVSGEESNGSDMDIDDEQPPRKLIKSAAPATSTNGNQTPGAQALGLELGLKQRQLAVMKAKLQKKIEALKKGQATAATTATDGPGTSPQVPTPAAPVPPMQSEHTQQSKTHALPTTKGDTRDAKRLRRAEIQSKLPTFDLETANNASRIAQLTKEIEALTAQNEKIAKDKAMLIAELEGLGVDTEGMSHAELRAKKNEIEREASPQKQDVEDRRFDDTEKVVEQPNPVSGAVSTTISPPATRQADPAPAEQLASSSEHVTRPSPSSSAIPGLEGFVRQPHEPARPLQHGAGRVLHADNIPIVSTRAVESTSQLAENSGEQTADPGTRTTGTPLDEDDFYSPPADLSSETQKILAQVQQESVSAIADAPQSPSEDGEVEMSESSGAEDDDEEEYDPEAQMSISEPLAQEAQNPRPEQGQSVSTSQVSTEDEESYEPPDVDADMDDGMDQTEDNPDSFGVIQVEAEDGAMDIESSSDSSDSELESEDDNPPKHDSDTALSTTAVPQNSANMADVLAPQPQLEIVPVVQPADIVAETDEDETPKFTPYESPLRMFKSYRYHPSYVQDIPGGFLSWTFSHQINPDKPLCQFEASGGTCNDPECPDQHFKDIGITGEKLLVQLGTANPGKTDEEKKRWNDGLRGVLKKLRAQEIKDPQGIAVEIANYRRQFLNDDTRVVNL